MKRIVIACLCTMIALFGLVSHVPTVSAATGGINSSICSDPALNDTEYCHDDTDATQTNSGSNTGIVGKVIKIAINILSFVGGVAAVVVILVSAIRITTSGGNSQSVGAARNAIIYSVVGIIVIILAQVIVLTFIGGTSTSTPDPNACGVGGQNCKS